LTGCNLRCKYCDTQYAFNEGTDLTEDVVLDKVRHSGMHLAEITGGEPLLQKDVYRLIKRLLDSGYTVLIETNGSLSVRNIDSRAVIVLDIKTPGSGESEKMDLSNISHIKKHDEIKFVITDRADYEWSKDFIEKHALMSKCHLLMSSAFGYLEPEKLAQWLIDDKLAVRLNLQLHKYMFDVNKRGI
jgi:7-carboxy-7-deazaguanine synthase